MARNIIIAPGEFYHLYNRGTEKRHIFSSQKDYDRFLALLYLCNSNIAVHLQRQGRTLKEASQIDRGESIVDICAFCLMPNHFHLLVREETENGISRFMQKLITGYTMYFNKQHERSGALFQGKYKATHANNDSYLRYLISYLHLNPVKLIDSTWKEKGIKDRKKAEEFIRLYRYSSYSDYLGHDRIEKIVINKDALPKYFETPTEFKTTVTAWLDYQGSTLT
ncbi:MAG: transposase [bacterium]|nr:transposase [bacterium]